MLRYHLTKRVAKEYTVTVWVRPGVTKTATVLAYTLGEAMARVRAEASIEESFKEAA